MQFRCIFYVPHKEYHELTTSEILEKALIYTCFYMLHCTLI